MWVTSCPQPAFALYFDAGAGDQSQCHMHAQQVSLPPSTSLFWGLLRHGLIPQSRLVWPFYPSLAASTRWGCICGPHTHVIFFFLLNLNYWFTCLLIFPWGVFILYVALCSKYLIFCKLTGYFLALFIVLLLHKHCISFFLLFVSLSSGFIALRCVSQVDLSNSSFLQ